ncbi:MalY/PatB family protein [Sulfurospirillum sp. 1612]|uniref:MalY/PatB family protein n=1 Tax=Sulfurospirillum sp. 1612 TaxID=3094835 RepID=UPI002F95232D
MTGFDQQINRIDTNCEKWNKYKDQDIIPAWVADMDFQSPPSLIQALTERVEHGIFGYTGMDDATIEATIAFVKRQHNWDIKKEWIVWTHGVVVSMNLVCRMLAADEEVITTTPIYPHFVKAPHNAKKTLTQVPLKNIDNRWTIDFDTFESSITPSCKLMLLCNPYNPGGTVFTREELERLSAICIAHDLIICSDEIHADLVINPAAKHIPIASLNSDIQKRSITLMAPSKTFNIAGLQSSFVIIPDKELRVRFQKELRGLGGDINVLAITATRVAYQDGDTWLADLKSYLLENFKMIQAFVEHNKNLKMLHHDATFLAWIDCSQLNTPHPYELFLKYGVGLSDGSGFGDKNFVRLNFGTDKKTLTQILSRMQHALNSLK